MNAQEATKLVGMLATAFPNARFSEENAALYESAIAGFSADECQAAVGELISTSRYLPTIAEIRGEIFRGRRDAQRLTESVSRLRLTTAAGETVGPSAAAWAPVHARMLDADARHRALAEAWYTARGKRPPPDPGAEFTQIAKDGAMGKDVSSRLKKSVLPGGFDDLERRFP